MIRTYCSMSYTGISIKEAINKVNQMWFLPAIQRPYVWGSRYGSEGYICKLFDSLYHKYPIGGLIMWETDAAVAHREFMTNYKQGDVYKNVDEGLYMRHKFLIYDGQQRLQTLFSCLKYTFNDRVLVFDLSYDESKDADGETGFRFVDQGEMLAAYEIKMNRLFSSSFDSKTKTSIRREYEQKTNDEALKERIDENLDTLWSVFVGEDVGSLAYFSIKSETEAQVNEIFERLNTGGMSLTKADLLFSRIKSPYPNFEAEVMEFSKKLFSRCKVGLDSYDILQLLHIIVKHRSRIDEKVTPEQIEEFKKTWDSIQMPLNALFDDYLVGHFHFSHPALIKSKNPILVLAVFFYVYYQQSFKFRHMSSEMLKQIDCFFIYAEINDWTLQSYTDNFARILLDNVDKISFPYQDLVAFVKNRGNRSLEISEVNFQWNVWFALKVLTPNRTFEIDYSMPNRFNPEIDHIFPTNLVGKDEKYKEEVNVLWNFQPVKGEVNNQKTNIHPKLFFTDQAVDSHGTKIPGSKYFKDYDFVPELTSNLWDDHSTFITWRREQMLKFMENQYGIKVVGTKKEDKTEPHD